MQPISLCTVHLDKMYATKLQEVGGTLIGVDGLVLMAGAELVEWYQLHQTHGLMPFHLLDESIIMSRPPLSSLHCTKPCAIAYRELKG